MQICGPIRDFYVREYYVQEYYVWEKFVAPNKVAIVLAGNTKGGSITVSLISYLTGLESAV